MESKTAVEEAEQKQRDMEAEMQKMQRELEEAKSAVTILELSKQDEIESVSRQYTQELASLQSIMKGTHLVLLINIEIQIQSDEQELFRLRHIYGYHLHLRLRQRYFLTQCVNGIIVL